MSGSTRRSQSDMYDKRMDTVLDHPTPGLHRMLKLDVSAKPSSVDLTITGNHHNNNHNNNTTSPLPSPSTSSSSQSSSAISPPLPQPHATPADPVHDLPPDMLAIGWRKFWSKREGRPYFFNKVTNESLWEPPHLPSNPLTDPLGIGSAPSIPPVTPTTPNEPLGFWPSGQRGEKRSLSLDSDSGQQWKRFILSGPWQLDKDSNVLMYERVPCLMHHPHPDVESMRGSLMTKLRSEYVTMCRSRENIDAPKESFNRWLMERKLLDRGSDPLFPSACSPAVSRSMYSEIMNDIPVKLFRPKFSGEARKQLSKYAEGAKALIEARNASSESRKIVKWNVEDTFQWIRSSLNASFDDYQERLRHLRHQCQPHLTEAAKSSVTAICNKMYSMSCEDAKRVHDKELEFMKQDNLTVITVPPRISQPARKVLCHPIQLAQSCPKLPVVQFAQEKDMVFLCYRNESLSLKQSYLQKLEYLYRYACPSDRVKMEFFLTRVWCLLKRYKSFLGPGPGEGHSAQVSLPTPVFEVLHKSFDVTFEAFASPLNCYFRNYCSAFPDTDGYFGSRGSFLSFHPMSGSLVVHPPYQEDLMEETVDHMERLLHNSPDPLSFIVLLPDWVDPVSKAVRKMDASRFKRKHLSLQAFEYEFRNGFQHICDPKDLVVKSPHNMLVFFVQNDAGFLRWGPTPDRLEALVEAFRPGRETSSPVSASAASSASAQSTAKPLTLLSPPPTPQTSVTGVSGSSSHSNNSSSDSESSVDAVAGCSKDSDFPPVVSGDDVTLPASSSHVPSSDP